MLKRIRALFSKNTEHSERAGATVAGRGAAAGPMVHRGPRVVGRPIPVQDLDPDAVKILRRLTRFDHTAYLVGGCVRDLLLDRKPKDFDIGTSATPRQVKRLFRNCRIIGRRFRLAHIYFHGNKVIEVATFRSRDVEDDGSGSGAGDDLMIRDDNVFGSPEEDALRRDFTINQLFYDVNEETVIDHAEGLEDLRRRCVRAIGDPLIRFREDPVRILRAIKFAARLDFQIEAGTREAIEACRDEIPKAATPRVLEEINRFGRGGAARKSFELLRETGVFEIVLQEFATGYGGDRNGAWDRSMELFAEMDRRHAGGHEASTAEILVALMLPLVAERIGWRPDGTAEPPRGPDARALADEYLRPMATRLRVSRKDQERSRQLLMTLSRMVPALRGRRSNRRSVLGNECFGEALWMLEVVASRYGGVFPEALAAWKSAQQSPGRQPARRGARRQAGAGAAQGAAAAPSRGRRRRGRRGGRRKTGAQEGGEPAAQPADAGGSEEKGKAEPERKAKLPSPWDDRYFFAALPTVPQLQEDKSAGDRYGAETVAPDDAPEREPGPPRPADETKAAERAAHGEGESAPETSRPRRRRRRGGRGRGRGRRKDGEDAGSSASADTEPAGANGPPASEDEP